MSIVSRIVEFHSKPDKSAKSPETTRIGEFEDARTTSQVRLVVTIFTPHFNVAK